MTETNITVLGFVVHVNSPFVGTCTDGCLEQVYLVSLRLFYCHEMGNTMSH